MAAESPLLAVSLYTLIRGLVINNLASASAIYIEGSSNNIIQCNFFSTNADGTAAVLNNVGINIANSSSGNLVGTDGDGVNDSNEGNLIWGNNIGITLLGSSVLDNTIAGNYIGTDITGTAGLGNTTHGGDKCDDYQYADSCLANRQGRRVWATVTIVGQTVTIVYPTLAVGQTVNFSIFTTVLQGVTVSNTACVKAANQGAE